MARVSSRVLIIAIVMIIAFGAIFYTLIAHNNPLERRTVYTTAPKVGIHTRLTDEVESWKMDKTYEMVREMGASWAVEYFPWSYIQPSEGSLQWDHPDQVVNAAYAQGINLIARIDSVPDWARPKDSTGRFLDKDSYQVYADFVYQFVQRYKGKIHYYIIWNEPNVTFEWGYQKVSPEDYTELLKVTYQRVKEADPDAQVIAAGLAPTLEESDAALDDLVYLQRMYDAGAKDYFDVMAAHAYGWKAPPDDPADPDRINFARVELTYQVMEKNGDGDKPVFITEGGWNDHPRWTKAVRPTQRIDYTVRAYQKAEEEWPWCQVVALWAFRLPSPTRTYNDYYTFVNFDFSPKPIYDAVKKFATGH